MTALLEPSVSKIRPDEPPMPAEAATDVPPATSLGDPDLVETAGSPEIVEPAASPASEVDNQVAAERHKLRERIRQSGSLSRGMRDRLTTLLEGESPAASDSQPLIRAADALALLEEAIPPQLRLDANSLAQPEHPAGDVFFTGDVNQMTDDQADRIAREQLAQSAFRRQ